MTDHNNGTYTFSYTISVTGIQKLNKINIGTVSVQVYLLTQAKLYHEYYSNYLSGSQISNWIVDGLKFNSSSTTNRWLSLTTEKSAKIISTIKAPYTGTFTFNVAWDYYWSIYFDNVEYIHNSAYSGTFTASLIQNKYYLFYVEWYNASGSYEFSLTWSYSGQSSIVIPSSYLYLPSLVYSSPYSVTVTPIWGDGLKISPEQWDDNNTDNGDGCSSGWNIESGWSWLGGSSSSKDTWTEICGDGKDSIQILPTAMMEMEQMEMDEILAEE